MKKKSLDSKLIHNSTWSIVGWLSLLLLSMVTSPVMIGRLGQDQYGLLALLMSVVAPLGLMDLGVGEATIKYVSESLGRAENEQAERFVRNTLTFNLVAGLAGWAIIVAASQPLIEHVFSIPTPQQPLARACLTWLGATWCATQVRQTFVGAVTALQQYRVVNIASFLTQLLTVGSSLLVLMWGGGLLLVVEVQSTMTVVSCAAWFVIARRALPNMHLWPRLDREVFRKTVSFGLWQNLNNLGGIITHQSQRWLLGGILTVASVGVYNVASQLVTTVYSLAYRGGQVIFPAVSSLQGQAKDREAAELMVEANWIMTSVVCSGFAALAIFAHDLLRLWISPEFAELGSSALRILCISHSVAVTCAIPSFFLLGTGRPKWLTAIAFAQGGIALPAALVLVPKFGVAGAAAAVTLGNTSQAAAVYLMWRALFQTWFRVGPYLAANFAPLLSSALVGLLGVRLRDDIAWSPGWIVLSACAAGVLICTWLVVQLVNVALPGGPERWNSMAALVGNMLPLRGKLRGS